MTETDAKDWLKVQQDDSRAFAEMFDKYLDRVFNLALRRCFNVDTAEEIAQNVFVEAWDRRHRIELRNGSLWPWLAGVTINMAKRSWRTSGRKQRALTRLKNSHKIEEASRSVNHIGDELVVFEELSDLVALISKLPASQRDVIELAAWENMSYEEISEALEVPIGTVRSRLSRARTTLKKNSELFEAGGN